MRVVYKYGFVRLHCKISSNEQCTICVLIRVAEFVIRF